MSASDSIGFLINNTGRKMTNHITALFQPYGLTPEQWYVLNRLALQDGVTQKELASRVGKDPANLTRILDQLERRALVERSSNPDDRRSFRLLVTDEGRRLDAVLSPIESRAVARLLQGADPADLDALRRVLELISSHAEDRAAHVSGNDETSE